MNPDLPTDLPADQSDVSLDPRDEDLQRRLAAETRFGRLLHIARCDSTQDVALRERGSLCVWADEQRLGRGRRGRSWHGSPAQDVEMTLRVEALGLERPELLAPALPCGVLLALESLCATRLTLKWPNDLLEGGRKVCGVLIDVHGGREPLLLIGIGVNVNRTRFPGELVERAAALGAIAGRTIDRHEVVARIAAAVDRTLESLGSGRTDELEEVFASRIGLVGRRAFVREVGGPERVGVVTALGLNRIEIAGGGIPLARIETLHPA